MRVLCLAMVLLATPAFADDPQEKVTVPKSMLTQEQLSQLNQKNLRENVSGWAGVGKEIGEAVNSSLQAVTTQSNNFAQTGVGKLTVILVVWKVIGDEFLHVAVGLLELVIFLPVWIWSYRRTCITRSFTMPDKTVKVIEYTWKGEFSPRSVHMVLLLGMVGVFLTTTFSY